MRRTLLWRSLICQGGLLLVAASLRAATNDAPSVVLVNPPNDTLLREGDTIKLQAEAGDSDGVVTKVEFYADGTLLGEDAVAPFSIVWSSAVLGSNQLTAIAIDDALARSTSAVVNVTVVTNTVLSLIWNPRSPADSNWNTTDINWRWRNQYTLFRPGDTVRFYPAPTPIFIGTEGSPVSVSPSYVSLWGSNTFLGGDILTGSLNVYLLGGYGPPSFLNYSGSLSFPGGTFGSVTYDVSGATNGANIHFGTGPIRAGEFAFQTASNRFTTLENDFIVGNHTTVVRLNPWNRPDVVATRFTGALNLGGTVYVTGYSPFGAGVNVPHEWAGPVVIDQSSSQAVRLLVGSGSKGLLVSGNISDGLGFSRRRLVLGVSYGNKHLCVWHGD